MVVFHSVMPGPLWAVSQILGILDVRDVHVSVPMIIPCLHVGSRYGAGPHDEAGQRLLVKNRAGRFLCLRRGTVGWCFSPALPAHTSSVTG